jgi:hypothetical protein
MAARGGGKGAQNWQWALGSDTQTAGLFVSNNLAWVSGKAYTWLLTYDGNGNGSYTVSDGALTLFANTYNGSAGNTLRTGNSLAFDVVATAAAGTARVQASVATINGQAVSGAIATAGNSQASQQSLYYYLSSPAGFTAQGSVSMVFGGKNPPAANNLQFLINAGNTACFATDQ